MNNSNLIKACKDILMWWEDAQYLIDGDCDRNVFDCDDDKLFSNLEKAMED